MKMTTRISMSVSQILVTAVVIASLALAGTEWRKKGAAESRERGDAATISGLSKQLGDLQKTADGYSTSLNRCQTQLATRPAPSDANAAPVTDADYVTVIASETYSAQASAQTDESTNPLVVLGNLYRPGLGTALGRLAPQGAPTGAGPSSPQLVRWVVAGKVTPYIAPGDAQAVVMYAWLNLKTNAFEERQPDPAGALIRQLQEQQGPH